MNETSGFTSADCEEKHGDGRDEDNYFGNGQRLLTS